MTHEIKLFCVTGGLSASAVLDALRARAAAEGVELRVTDPGAGDAWVNAWLSTGTSENGCAVEVRTASPLLDAVIAQFSADDPSGRVGATDALVTLLLAGSVDWAVVAALWRAAKELWEVVPHNDGAGFAVDLDEL